MYVCMYVYVCMHVYMYMYIRSIVQFVTDISRNKKVELSISLSQR